MRTQETTIEDILRMAVEITQEDLKEAQAANPKAHIAWDLMDYLSRTRANPEDLKMRSLYSSCGKLLLVGGWSSTGFTWMMSTVHSKDHPVATFKGVMECKRLALSQCLRLYNTMMLTNEGHVRLLEAIGAEFVGPITSIGGEPFQAFYIE